jgi:hypothetical protein
MLYLRNTLQVFPFVNCIALTLAARFHAHVLCQSCLVDAVRFQHTTEGLIIFITKLSPMSGMGKLFCGRAK